MNMFILGGRGKVGSLVAEVARKRLHNVVVLDVPENAGARALTRDALQGVDVVLDFTSPDAVLENIAACIKGKANMVVGTTGWYGEIPRIKALVQQSGIGFLYAANF